ALPLADQLYPWPCQSHFGTVHREAEGAKPGQYATNQPWEETVHISWLPDQASSQARIPANGPAGSHHHEMQLTSVGADQRITKHVQHDGCSNAANATGYRVYTEYPTAVSGSPSAGRLYPARTIAAFWPHSPAQRLAIQRPAAQGISAHR